MEYSIYDFKNAVNDVLKTCQLYLNDRSFPREATDEEIIEVIIPEMYGLLDKIERKDLPPKNQRWINSSGYASRVWGWDIYSYDKLMLQLCELSNLFNFVSTDMSVKNMVRNNIPEKQWYNRVMHLSNFTKSKLKDYQMHEKTDIWRCGRNVGCVVCRQH